MRFTKLALTLLCSTVLFCGCTKDNSIALKINDETISKKEFYDDYNRIKNAQLKNLPKEMKKEDGYPSLMIKREFLNGVIARELLVQEFEKRKITASEEEIKAQKENLIKQVGSLETFNNLLKENGISEEKLNSDMMNEVRIEKLYQSIKKENVSDKEVERFYKENKSKFDLPQRVKASHILFKTSENEIRSAIVAADKEAKLSQEELDKKVKEEIARIEKLVNEVRQKAVNNPKLFAQLAKEYSQDLGSAQQGGDLGYIVKEQVVPEFGEVAFKQKVGTISQPVKSQFGTHIIYVTDKVAAGVQPLSEVKADLKQYLAMQKKAQTMKEFVEGLKSKAKIEYVDQSLNPLNLERDIQGAIAKQKELEQKVGAPKSKLKKLDKLKKESDKK